MPQNMNTKIAIEKLLGDQYLDWVAASPAEKSEIEKFVAACPFILPGEYLQFLSICNGGEGSIGHSSQSINIYPADLVLSNNEQQSVQEFNPELLAFADNGGGELFLFNTAEPQPWKIYALEGINMDMDDASLVANSFVELISLLGHECRDNFRCVEIETGKHDNLGWAAIEGDPRECSARALVDAFPDLFTRVAIIRASDDVDISREVPELVQQVKPFLKDSDCCVVESHKLFVVSENSALLEKVVANANKRKSD